MTVLLPLSVTVGAVDGVNAVLKTRHCARLGGPGKGELNGGVAAQQDLQLETRLLNAWKRRHRHSARREPSARTRLPRAGPAPYVTASSRPIWAVTSARAPQVDLSACRLIPGAVSTTTTR